MLSREGYYFFNSWSGKPLALWGFGSYQLHNKVGVARKPTLWRGWLKVYCMIIVYRSSHSCRTRAKPFDCIVKEDSLLPPPHTFPQRRALPNVFEMKAFHVCAHMLCVQVCTCIICFYAILNRMVIFFRPSQNSCQHFWLRGWRERISQLAL